MRRRSAPQPEMPHGGEVCSPNLSTVGCTSRAPFRQRVRAHSSFDTTSRVFVSRGRCQVRPDAARSTQSPVRLLLRGLLPPKQACQESSRLLPRDEDKNGPRGRVPPSARFWSRPWKAWKLWGSGWGPSGGRGASRRAGPRRGEGADWRVRRWRGVSTPYRAGPVGRKNRISTPERAHEDLGSWQA